MVDAFAIFVGQAFMSILAAIICVAKFYDIYETWKLLRHNSKSHEDELKKLEFLSKRNLAFINVVLISIPLSLAGVAYIYPQKEILGISYDALINLSWFLILILVFEIITHTWITQKYAKLITKKK